MSCWTYLNGIITVSPIGETQAQKRYILDTVLSHLPKVTGSEEDMCVEVIQEQGYNCSSSSDEFMQRSNLGRGCWNEFETQSNYKIIVYGYFRDRMIEETYKEFMKWLCRLAKRVWVDNILVNINDGLDGSKTICYTDVYENPFHKMFEDFSWLSDGKSVNWCEYMTPVYGKKKKIKTEID